MVFSKEFFESVHFEKNQQTTKNMINYPACKKKASVVANVLSHGFENLINFISLSA